MQWPPNAANAANRDPTATAYLLFNLVGATEHVVNVGEIIGTREEAIGLSGGGIALLQVGILTEVTHLEVERQPCASRMMI